MKKLYVLTFSLFVLSMAKAQSDDKNALLIGFNSTGSEFVFWESNTYGLNVQYLREIAELGGGFSSLSLKGAGIFADGFTGGYGGLNIRVDEPFFVDMDVLFGYSNITNAELLKTYERNTTEYKDLAFITSLGVGYRFPSNPLILRLAYGVHWPISSSSGFNGALNLQLGVKF